MQMNSTHVTAVTALLVEIAMVLFDTYDFKFSRP